MSLDLIHVPADENQLINMLASAKAGKLIATPANLATKAAGWLPSAHFIAVTDKAEHVAAKLDEIRTSIDKGQLETIRQNGMALASKLDVPAVAISHGEHNGEPVEHVDEPTELEPATEPPKVVAAS